MIHDLEELSMPAYDLLDIETYKATVGASIMFSRGCAFQCSFCATRTVHGSKVRFKNNDQIMREFEYLVDDLNFRTIIIEDDLFAARKKEFFDLADRIKSLNLSIKFKLPQGLSVAMLDEDVIEVITSMGIDEGAIAIESGSEYTQKHLIKKMFHFLRQCKY